MPVTPVQTGAFRGKRLKPGGKAAGCYEIRPEMLKALNREVLWPTRLCEVAWCSVKTPKDGQTGVIIPMCKKRDRSKCTNNAKCLEKRCREIIEPELDDTQCGLRPGRSTTDKIFTRQQIFKKSSQCARYVYTQEINNFQFIFIGLAYSGWRQQIFPKSHLL